MRSIVRGAFGIAILSLVGCASWPAHAVNTQNVGVCDPANQQNCAKPNADGSFNVTGSFAATLSGFAPNAQTAVSASVTSSSSRVALPGSSAVVLVGNKGTTPAFVRLGDNTVTASVNDIMVPAGGGCALTVNSNAYIASITATGTTTLNIQGGTGLAQTCFGGGGGGTAGGTVAIDQSNPGVSNGVVDTAVGTNTANIASAMATVAQDSSLTNIQDSHSGNVGNRVYIADPSNGNPIQYNVPNQSSYPYTVSGPSNITAVDSASSTTSGYQSASIITGSPSANSTFSSSISSTAGQGTVCYQVTGTWSGTLQSEASSDGGTTWVVRALLVSGTSASSQTFTGNGVFCGEVASATNIRLRATTFSSGTAAVRAVLYPEAAVVKMGPIPTGTNTIGGVTPVASTSGGLISTSCANIVPNNTTGVSCKTSAGQVYHVEAYNNSATVAWLKLYDKSSAPTCGTDTPVSRRMIPANGGFVIDIALGKTYSSGIGYCVTTGVADSDTGAPAASTYTVEVDYK